MALRFVIYGFDYTQASGGVMAMYRLLDNMRTISRRVSFVSVGRDATRPIIERPCSATDVAIYPECIVGNPAGAKRVVRWVLYTPGKISNGDGVFGRDDLIYLWSSAYSVNPLYRVAGLLTSHDFHLDLFVDRGEPREGTCFVIRKGRGHCANQRFNQHPRDSVSVEHYAQFGSNPFLAQVFSQFKTFISYDAHTQLFICAALCGCKSIVIPDPRITRKAWRDAQGPYARAIHYGFNDPEPNGYTPTMFRADLQAAEKQSLDQARTFVQNCEEKWG